MQARLVSVLLASAVLGCGFVIEGNAGADEREQPAVRVAAVSPIVITAAGFGPREQIRVVVYASAKRTRFVRTDIRGGFRTVFRDLAPAQCGAVSVIAYGASGGRAGAVRWPQPGCLMVRVPAADR